MKWEDQLKLEDLKDRVKELILITEEFDNYHITEDLSEIKTHLKEALDIIEQIQRENITGIL